MAATGTGGSGGRSARGTKIKKTATAKKTAKKKTTSVAMAKWGGITFKVNTKQVFTFKNMKRSYSGRWASHSIIGKRPKMEFQGPNNDEIKIDVILDGELGVKPRAMLTKFRDAAKKGKVDYFYVGGKKVAENKFYIENGTENWDKIWNKGELVKATASLTFKEYT